MRTIARSRAHFERSRATATANEVREQGRAMAARLVEYTEGRTGSRMSAYSRVASGLGVSAYWLRQLIGRRASLVIAAHEYLNIQSAYRDLCEHIEASAEIEHLKFIAIERQIDAALRGNLNLAALQDASEESRTSVEDSPARSSAET